MTSSARVRLRVWSPLPQHSDSEGALPRPTSEGSGKQEEEEEEEEEELSSRRFSLEELSISEGEEQKEELEEEEELCLSGSGEQVEDFATSVLAAISCWHIRVATVTVRPLPAALDLRLC